MDFHGPAQVIEQLMEWSSLTHALLTFSPIGFFISIIKAEKNQEKSTAGFKTWGLAVQGAAIKQP